MKRYEQKLLLDRINDLLIDYAIIIKSDPEDPKHRQMLREFEQDVAPHLIKMDSAPARLKGYIFLLQSDPDNKYFQDQVNSLKGVADRYQHSTKILPFKRREE